MCLSDNEVECKVMEIKDKWGSSFSGTCENYLVEYNADFSYDDSSSDESCSISDPKFSFSTKSVCEDRCDYITCELTNVLFDEDIDMNQPTLCFNVYKKYFHVVSNPLLKECAQESEFVDGNSFLDFCILDVAKSE